MVAVQNWSSDGTSAGNQSAMAPGNQKAKSKKIRRLNLFFRIQTDILTYVFDPHDTMCCPQRNPSRQSAHPLNSLLHSCEVVTTSRKKNAAQKKGAKTPFPGT